MNRTASQRITICTSCKHKGSDRRPGYELIARLRKAIEAAGDAASKNSAERVS